MKKEIVIAILFGVVMAIVFSTMFVFALKSYAGIGVGCGFGVCFGLLGSVLASEINNRD